MAKRTCFRISSSKISSDFIVRPPVSIMLNVLPFHTDCPYCLSRVTPLTASTIAFLILSID